MILSNLAIIEALAKGHFSVDPSPGTDASAAPFNTSALDLRLGREINIPDTAGSPIQLDLRNGGIARFLAQHCNTKTITEDQPYSLQPHRFILANTLERVSFPLETSDGTVLAARVEGKSSFARCGLLVHFTAPTIHAGFSGPITLEIINLGPAAILLTPGMFICQLILEEVKGKPANAPNQFKNQVHPVGT
jgi:dCTP deaminase